MSTGTDAADLPEERRVQHRARYLETTTTLSERQAEAVAWSEEGYSASGVAQQMDTSESTVRSYYGVAIARYGMDAVGATFGVDVEADLSAITRSDLEGYSSGVVTAWYEFADDNREHAPEEALEFAEKRASRWDDGGEGSR